MNDPIREAIRRADAERPPLELPEDWACTFRVPWPVSANKVWTPVVVDGGQTARQVLSTASKHYRMAVLGELLEQQVPRLRINLPLGLEVVLRPPSDRGDTDNVLKALQDALEAAGVIDNDRRFRELHVYHGDVVGEADARLEVRVWRLRGGRPTFPRHVRP